MRSREEEWLESLATKMWIYVNSPEGMYDASCKDRPAIPNFSLVCMQKVKQKNHRRGTLGSLGKKKENAFT